MMERKRGMNAKAQHSKAFVNNGLVLYLIVVVVTHIHTCDKVYNIRHIKAMSIS